MGKKSNKLVAKKVSNAQKLKQQEKKKEKKAAAAEKVQLAQQAYQEEKALKAQNGRNGNSEKKNRPAAQFNIQTHPFVKKLADNDKSVRESTLNSLSQFLQTKKEIPPLEFLKLWRALFFSMWMSDRPLIQQKLADDLANLLAIVEPINYSAFLDAFWTIMAREWEGLDRYRLDKFYLLLRRYVAASLRKLKAEDWDEDWVDDLVAILRHVPLNLHDVKVPNGIRFHVFDIILDEFERVMKENDVAFTKGVGLAIAPNTKNVKLPEFHTVDSDGEEESDSDASDSEDENDDDDSEDEGYVPETEQQKLTKQTKEQQEKQKEQAERAKEWVLIGERIRDNKVPLEKILEPIKIIAEKSQYKHVRDAAKEVMEDPRLIVWGLTEGDDEDDDEEFTGFD